MSDVRLGNIIVSDAQRDAIHIAIAPVVAADLLYPGEHVGLNAAGEASRYTTHIGVVDPFLKVDEVRRGEMFYLCLYQNTVTGMRHHWSHPSFLEKEEKSDHPVFDKKDSETWLRNFVHRNNCPDYDTVIAAVTGQVVDGDTRYANRGDSIVFYGEDAGCEIPPEFYLHLQIVTGIDVDPGKRVERFSCSC